MVHSIISLEPCVQFAMRYNVQGPMDSAILLIIIIVYCQLLTSYTLPFRAHYR